VVTTVKNIGKNKISKIVVTGYVAPNVDVSKSGLDKKRAEQVVVNLKNLGLSKIAMEAVGGGGLGVGDTSDTDNRTVEVTIYYKGSCQQ
jgi:hypothetical protein